MVMIEANPQGFHSEECRVKNPHHTVMYFWPDEMNPSITKMALPEPDDSSPITSKEVAEALEVVEKHYGMIIEPAH